MTSRMTYTKAISYPKEPFAFPMCGKYVPTSMQLVKSIKWVYFIN